MPNPVSPMDSASVMDFLARRPEHEQQLLLVFDTSEEGDRFVKEFIRYGPRGMAESVREKRLVMAQHQAGYAAYLGLIGYSGGSWAISGQLDDLLHQGLPMLMQRAAAKGGVAATAVVAAPEVAARVQDTLARLQLGESPGASQRARALMPALFGGIVVRYGDVCVERTWSSEVLAFLTEASRAWRASDPAVANALYTDAHCEMLGDGRLTVCVPSRASGIDSITVPVGEWRPRPVEYASLQGRAPDSPSPHVALRSHDGATWHIAVAPEQLGGRGVHEVGALLRFLLSTREVASQLRGRCMLALPPASAVDAEGARAAFARRLGAQTQGWGYLLAPTLEAWSEAAAELNPEFECRETRALWYGALKDLATHWADDRDWVARHPCRIAT